MYLLLSPETKAKERGGKERGGERGSGMCVVVVKGGKEQ